jgi:hypothetical protein
VTSLGSAAGLVVGFAGADRRVHRTRACCSSGRRDLRWREESGSSRRLSKRKQTLSVRIVRRESVVKWTHDHQKKQPVASRRVHQQGRQEQRERRKDRFQRVWELRRETSRCCSRSCRRDRSREPLVAAAAEVVGLCVSPTVRPKARRKEKMNKEDQPNPPKVEVGAAG